MSTSDFLFDGFRFFWMYCSLTFVTCMWSSASFRDSAVITSVISLAWLQCFVDGSPQPYLAHVRGLVRLSRVAVVILFIFICFPWSSTFCLRWLLSSLDYCSLTLSTLWSSACSVEIVIIVFLLVSHCWTLELSFRILSS